MAETTFIPAPYATAPVCTTCGTQFPLSHDTSATCPVCADPRQYVPPSGSTYTTLPALVSAHHNDIAPLRGSSAIHTITTSPKFAIGQRAFFIKTASGNILWDLIALLDAPTIAWIAAQGGLQAIYISHPHYYTTHGYWASVFRCPIHVAVEDWEWLDRVKWGGTEYEFGRGDGVGCVTVGGHFPGSRCLLVRDEGVARLMIADSLVTVPSAKNPEYVRDGRAAYAFMWSIPNMIPMTHKMVAGVWGALRGLDFGATHGAFEGMDIVDQGVKKRVKESAEIAIRATGGDPERWEVFKDDRDE